MGKMGKRKKLTTPERKIPGKDLGLAWKEKSEAKFFGGSWFAVGKTRQGAHHKYKRKKRRRKDRGGKEEGPSASGLGARHSKRTPAGYACVAKLKAVSYRM